MTRRLARRPYFSPGSPEKMAPMTAPASAAATVMPSCAGVSEKLGTRVRVVPEITAVSNPKRSPPSAPTRVERTRYRFSFMRTYSRCQCAGSYVVRLPAEHSIDVRTIRVGDSMRFRVSHETGQNANELKPTRADEECIGGRCGGTCRVYRVW